MHCGAVVLQLYYNISVQQGKVITEVLEKKDVTFILKTIFCKHESVK